jgi:hypothetical protein
MARNILSRRIAAKRELGYRARFRRDRNQCHLLRPAKFEKLGELGKIRAGQPVQRQGLTHVVTRPKLAAAGKGSAISWPGLAALGDRLGPILDAGVAAEIRSGNALPDSFQPYDGVPLPYHRTRHEISAMRHSSACVATMM